MSFTKFWRISAIVFWKFVLFHSLFFPETPNTCINRSFDIILLSTKAMLIIFQSLFSLFHKLDNCYWIVSKFTECIFCVLYIPLKLTQYVYISIFVSQISSSLEFSLLYIAYTSLLRYPFFYFNYALKCISMLVVFCLQDWSKF